MNQLSQQADAALEVLAQCHTNCRAMALVHCLETGGEHARPQHLRLMIDCAEICAVTADLIAHKSQFHTQACALCVEVCETCAEDCDKLGQMEECAAACSDCAKLCREMARSDRAAKLKQGATHPPA